MSALRRGIGYAMVLLGLGMHHAYAASKNTLQGIQIQKLGVSISNLQLSAPSLAIGQNILASYQFTDTFGRDARDASIYLWGIKGTTAGQINSAGQAITHSGVVPARTLQAADVGTILEVSVQARNTLGKKGNILTVATDSLSIGKEGKIENDSITPRVSNLLITGELSVGQILTASYQFDANGGEHTDRTTYKWGYKGYTANKVSTAAAVQNSGQVPSYTIQTSDAGQVLELSIQAKNGATPVGVGNVLTVTTDGSRGSGNSGGNNDGSIPTNDNGSNNNGGINNTTGGNNGRVIDPNVSPSITQLVISGNVQVGGTLHARYSFHAHEGEPTDKTTYIWGSQGMTAALVQTGPSVVTSGIVPSYTIQATDVGQILELSLQAKNNSITSIAGNILTATIADAIAAPLNVVGGSYALTIGQTNLDLNTITVSGGKEPYHYNFTDTVRNTLAANGLSLNAMTGKLTAAQVSGPAFSATDYAVIVIDSSVAPKNTANAVLRLTINPAPVATQALASQTYVNGDSANITPVTGSGGTGPLTYSISPALGNGLTINTGTGAITGTVTGTPGQTTYTVTVTDTNGVSTSATFDLIINDTLMASALVANAVLTDTQSGINFTPVVGRGGVGNLSYSVTPALSNGLTLDLSTGAITGSATGTLIATTYTVTVSDSAAPLAHTASARFTLTVNSAPTATQVVATPTYLNGDAVHLTPIVGSGGTEPLSYDIHPPFAPGLSFDPLSGTITGNTNGTPSDTIYTVTVTDANGVSASNTFNFIINNALVASSAVANKIFTETQSGINFTPVVGSGGSGSLSYSVSPLLANGLTLDTSTGAITGSATGTLPPTVYTITVSDSARPMAHTVDVTFTLTVNAAPTATQRIAAQTYINGDTVNLTPVIGSGGTGPLSYSIQPALQNGLSFDAATGAITGEVTEGASQTTYTVTVTDVNGVHASNTFALTINYALTAAAMVASKELTATQSGINLTPVIGSGGIGNLSYSISPALSNGLDFDTNTGTISGTVTGTLASTVYTVTVSDSALPQVHTASATFNLAINPAPIATQVIASQIQVISENSKFIPVLGGGGTGTLSYSITPTLPRSLRLNQTTGEVLGIATTVSSSKVYTITVTDENGVKASNTFTLALNNKLTATPTLTSKALTATQTGISFTPVTATGGIGELSYSISPTLPTGLVLDKNTGVITGSAIGVVAPTIYTITISDSAEPEKNSVKATFNLTVNEAPLATQDIASYLQIEGEGGAFTPIIGSGGTDQLSYSITPKLPRLLNINYTTGEIIGIATEVSSATLYTITVTDVNGIKASNTFTLAVGPKLIATAVIPSKVLTVMQTEINFTPVVGSGGRGDLSYSIAPALPNGLNLDTSTGAITGTATALLPKRSYTVTVSDSSAPTKKSASTTFSLAINTAAVKE